MIAGMLGCGTAGSFRQLLIWRWVTGLGSALQMSGSQLCLADISTAENRARCLGTNQVSVRLVSGPSVFCCGCQQPYAVSGNSC